MKFVKHEIKLRVELIKVNVVLNFIIINVTSQISSWSIWISKWFCKKKFYYFEFGICVFKGGMKLLWVEYNFNIMKLKMIYYVCDVFKTYKWACFVRSEKIISYWRHFRSDQTHLIISLFGSFVIRYAFEPI